MRCAVIFCTGLGEIREFRRVHRAGVREFKDPGYGRIRVGNFADIWGDFRTGVRAGRFADGLMVVLQKMR